MASSAAAQEVVAAAGVCFAFGAAQAQVSRLGGEWLQWPTGLN